MTRFFLVHKDSGDDLGLMDFYYNSTKHSTTKMSPFESAWGVEAKQHMNLAIPKIGGVHYKGGKNVELKTIKKHTKKNTQAKRFLKKTHAKYEKQTNKI